jgi:adenylyltransferase/sulfurtransferase
MIFKELKIPRDPDCPLCGKNPTVTKLIDYNQFCGVTQCEFPMKKQETSSDDIAVEQVKTMLDRKDDFVFVDVRNPDERAICKIEGTQSIPLPELPQRFKELPKEKLIVLHCHHGGRSMRAVKFLRSQGYEKLKSVDGGIDQWAKRFDPNMPRY